MMRDAGSADVLLVCDYFIRYTTGLAQGMHAIGSNPALLARDQTYAFGGETGALRSYVDDRLPHDAPRRLIEHRILDPRGLPSTAAASRFARRIRPAVTHLQTCAANDPRLVIAASASTRRFALTLHDVVHHPGDRAPRRRHVATYHWMMRHAGVVFVHADTLRDELAEQRLTDAPIEVVPHGVDRAEPSAPPETPSLLFFGRISEYKGLPVLLEAMVGLWRRHPELRLTIAGEGPLTDHPALGDDRIRVLNRHIAEDEVPDLFRTSSIVVLPYLEASQSGVGSLAKGHGRPIVASAVGGLPELLADGSGLLVAPGDARALAEGLESLLVDRDRREGMRAAALRSIETTAGWRAVAEATADAYARHLGVDVSGNRRDRD